MSPGRAGGRVAWLECSAGASGDMLLGALVDAGAPLEAVQAAVDALGVEPVRLRARHVTRHGLAATKVDVDVAPSDTPRTWRDVRGLLEAADLAADVRRRALDVFARLARAEAKAHRTDPEDVHFHEVGALDALADVVGTAAALAALGVTRAVCSPVALGTGTARSGHGVVPVPGPAVLALLAEAGAPVHSGPAGHELCTPTGAALLASIADAWGGMPLMRVEATGSGAGTRDLTEVPNLLRVVLGAPVPAGADEGAVASAVLLSTNVDDLDPRLWPPVITRLLDAGAADAWLTPMVMKKGRPAHTLSVLTAHEHVEALRRVVFTETSAIGLREQVVGRVVLERELRTVDVGGQTVRVKLARLDGELVSAQPEYEDVAAAAQALGRPVKAVLAASVAAAHEAGWG